MNGKKVIERFSKQDLEELYSKYQSCNKIAEIAGVSVCTAISAAKFYGIRVMTQSEGGKKQGVLNRGSKHSEETKAKMSLAKKGKPSPFRGRKLSQEVRDKIGKSQIGRKTSEETRKKLSAGMMGRSGEWLRGRHLSEEHRRKISAANSGEKSWMWKGGYRNLLHHYGSGFNLMLKDEVKKSFCFSCAECHSSGEKLSIHHKDYVKQNNSIYNFVPLCDTCHAYTNHNRDKWFFYYNLPNDGGRVTIQ